MMYKIDRYCVICPHRCVWNVLINRNLFLLLGAQFMVGGVAGQANLRTNYLFNGA